MKMLFIPKISYFWSGQSKSVSQKWSRNQSYDVRKAGVKMQQNSYRRKDVFEIAATEIIAHLGQILANVFKSTYLKKLFQFQNSLSYFT